MTDFEKYKQLFTETGVRFSTDNCEWAVNDTPEDFNFIYIVVDDFNDDETVVRGYSCFNNTLKFCKQSGKLVEFGIWE